MAHSSRSRRSRYHRAPERASGLLAGAAVTTLGYVATHGPIIVGQLVRLTGRTERCVLRDTRAAFDAGLLDVLPVPRAALLPDEAQLSRTANLGTGPNVYVITRNGVRFLRERGLVDGEITIPKLGAVYVNLFLRHRLMVTDLRIWFTLVAREHGHSLSVWREGAAAEIDLDRMAKPKKVRSDAWGRFQLGEKVLVFLVEIDRGTERGTTRWDEKVAAYAALFAGTKLKEVTGYQNARLLVITSTERRRAHLADLLGRIASPSLQSRTWIADTTVFDNLDFAAVRWQRPGSSVLCPLIAAKLACTGDMT